MNPLDYFLLLIGLPNLISNNDYSLRDTSKDEDLFVKCITSYILNE